MTMTAKEISALADALDAQRPCSERQQTAAISELRVWASHKAARELTGGEVKAGDAAQHLTIMVRGRRAEGGE